MMKARPLRSLPVAAVLTLLTSPVFAVSPVSGRYIQATAGPGELIEAKGIVAPTARAEIVIFDGGLTPALLGTAADRTVHVTDWPVGPDARADVALTRFEVYAPDAKIYVVKPAGLREVPRSRLAFFSGTAEDDPDVRVFAAVDPDTGAVDGFVQTLEALYEIHPLSAVPSLAQVGGTRRHVVALPEVFLAERGEKPGFTCGQTGAPLDFQQEMAERWNSAPPESLFASAISTLHTATLGVDTDNEFMQLKFSNNTTTATNYIASLIASMTAVYERDVLVRLLQGTTFLRPSTVPDPYVQNGSGNADVAKLQEFSNYWNTTNAAVPRAVAMMLSGKQTGGGASGIAWINGLCNKFSGNSFSQVFVSGTTPSSGDVLVVAHEIGHNFSSPHTHCYSPPIDNCYNAEPGCFSGTQTCPAPQTINGVTNVTGTLMSYCHLSGLGGCTSKAVFHPRTVSEKLAPAIQTATQGPSACIFPFVNPVPTITSVLPASGLTSGGTAVMIKGTNFIAGATVTIGGTAATQVAVVDSTTITALAPAHAAGKVSVVVTNPSTDSATLNPGFFYAAPPPETDFYTVTPCRVLDTRNPNGPLGGPTLSGGQSRTFTMTGTCGIPANAKSIVINVTAVTPTATGNFQLYPGNAFPMGATVNSFPPAANLATFTIQRLATDGTGTLGVMNGSAGTVDLVIDVTGYNL